MANLKDMKVGEVYLGHDGINRIILFADKKSCYTEQGGRRGAWDRWDVEDWTLVKPEPKTEWLYECLNEAGSSMFYFKDGHYPHFGDKRKSHNIYLECLKRKTGRKIKINMDTFELIGGVVNE